MPKDVTFNANPKYWRVGTASDGRNTDGRLLCLVCRDGIWRHPKHCPRHEQSLKHLAHIEFFDTYSEDDLPRGQSLVGTSTGLITSNGFIPAAHPLSSRTHSTPGPLERAFSRSQMNAMDVDVMDADSAPHEHTVAGYDGDMDTFDDCASDEGSLDMNYRMEDYVDTMIVAQTTLPIQQWLTEGPDIDSDTYSIDSEPEEVPDFDYAIDASMLSAIYTNQSRVGDENSTWFPWPNRTFCILDILRNLPRSIFSDKQNDIIHWGMNVLGISGVPSDNSVKNVMQSLQFGCGIRTIRYEGALGHVYYLNDLLSLIAQEMANPHVRPFLHFFPEDSGKSLENAYEARCWLKEMDEELLTQVVTVGSQKYYIFEPAILDDQTCCIPARWFQRKGELFASAWKLRRQMFLGSEYWIALEYDCYEFPISRLAVSFPYFLQSFPHRRLPSPTEIIGSLRSPDGNVRPWGYTNRRKGNRWREIAGGRPVYAFPIWLYCDDTSGNKTKKWNKHNSFLFISAGLPHQLVHREYNLHFISTSNLAEPLEMLEGIVEQIEYGQAHGIWAWDCVANEMVVLIPSVLALLGDNPMQSEFASHIGMNGKRFCRVCLVSNPSVPEEENVNTNERGATNAQDGGDSSGVDDSAQASDNQTDSDNPVDATPQDGAGSNGETEESLTSKRKGKRKTTAANKGKQKAGPKKKQAGGRGKKYETLNQLVERTREFLTLGQPRSKSLTTANLIAIYRSWTTVRGMSRAKTLKTMFGLKDKYQDFFMNEIARFSQGFSELSISEKQFKMDEYIYSKKFPKYPMNPVWRIKSLDANRDTPVEILHVVLLGFIKYFWRDAIARLKPDAKAALIVRISSFDTSGLGLPPLSGKTLVQYSGSLTGRDFRAVAQIGPLVLYDMLPKECYDAWLALSALVPLIWMPVIKDLETYLTQLTNAINRFLDFTARFTPRWFNKPKFHILLHLPEHIRRFGPAVLFATEVFESYNALIRDHSVHSNRQAPSRDIGQGFANANRIRHLTSGGKFYMGEIPQKKHLRDDRGKDRSDKLKKNHELSAEDFRVAGSDALAFIRSDQQLQKYIGFPTDASGPSKAGFLKKSKGGTRNWLETKSSRTISVEMAKRAKLDSHSFADVNSCVLLNGDSCSLDSWVVIRRDEESTCIARIVEILQITGSESEFVRQPDLILVVIYTSGALAEIYRLPTLYTTGNYAIVPYKDVLCLASVVHNCADRKCGFSNTRVVRQEREDIAERALAVCHINPEDVVLNCFKMRDYQHIQPFCPLFQLTERESMIHEGSVREIEARKSKAQRLAASTNEGSITASRTASGCSENGVLMSPSGSRRDITMNAQNAVGHNIQSQHAFESRLESPAEGSNSSNRRRSQVPKNPLERVRKTR